VDVIDIEHIESFVSLNVKVSIQGESGEELAPTVQKMLYKVAPCPDHTHLRLYFDYLHFIAIPFTSEVTWSDQEFCAYDQYGKLSYSVRKE
jgi:hypothetical protein